MPDRPSTIFNEFPTPGLEDWLALVEKTLMGKPLAKLLRSESPDGILIDALGNAENTKIEPQPVARRGDWLIASPHWLSDAVTVNKDLLEDLERGASAVAIKMGCRNGSGVAPEDLEAALSGVYLDMVPVNLIQDGSFEPGVDAFRKMIEAKKYADASITGCLGVDPMGGLARTGSLPSSAEQSIDVGARLASDWCRWQPRVATFTADGTVFANAGATEAQEIAAALSSAVTYLRAMERTGLSLPQAASQIQFTFSASSDLWLTISKFRAARRVWQKILADCGVMDVQMHINAVSAIHRITKKDPWVNILRGTAACFSAALGGANTITTLPHDIFLGTVSKFSRRIARNIQIVLLEESNLAKVTDPAAGSFALEKLTADLAEAIANAFAAFEQSGGILAALRSGGIAAQLEQTFKTRSIQVRQRRIPITGVSEFPDIHEVAPVPVDQDANQKGENQAAGECIDALPLRRLAEEFETLRFKSDRILAATGKRPRIFLANMGKPADFTARATFAKNFFEAGGVEVIAGQGARQAEMAVKQYIEASSKFAVICGTDGQYDEWGGTIASALKAAGCEHLFLAGRASDSLLDAGVDDSIYIGRDVVEVLETIYLKDETVTIGAVQ